MSAHSPTGASSMYRWEACPGSVRLCEQAPEAPPSPYAEEGTRAHALAAAWLRSWPDEPVVFDPSMRGHVAAYVEVCRDYYTEEHQAAGAVRWIEQHLDASRSIPGMYGTADYLVYWPWSKTLIVVDFKYGSGVYVSAQQNTQLLYYAVAAQYALGLTVDHAHLMIVQPRYESAEGPLRWSDVTGEELQLFEQHVRRVVALTQHPGATLHAGDHCRFCPAKSICPELTAVRDRALQSQFAVPVVPEQPHPPYRAEELAKALHSIPALKAYIAMVDGSAYEALGKGEVIPGYKLVEKRPTRTIADPMAAKSALNAAGYADTVIMTEPELKSPAQLEKVLKTEKGLLQPYIVAASSGYVVVPESDTRPAIDGRNATTDFLSPQALGLEG